MIACTSLGIAWSAALALACIGCRAANDPSHGHRSGEVTFARDGVQLSAVPAPYVTVMDSLVVDVSEAGGDKQRIARKLRPVDTLLTFPVTLSDGNVTVSANVTSVARTVLFNGGTSSTITADGFSISVPLRAMAPVLVVGPDTLRYQISQTGGLRTDTLRLYNRGTGSMRWTARYVTGACGRCLVLPDSGTLLGGAESQVRLVHLYSQAATASFVVAAGQESLVLPILIRP